ncbi:MORN repeat-containing protein [Lapidilactobacillus bayanensis]|uniref:hypothetical protein n=1 Tax=Lapidilactobacillus bayanensis TaxID=2485998 RepID=UPI0013DDF03A|nr:hypothetical protein [Lapidilactobacillus bayanensis]
MGDNSRRTTAASSAVKQPRFSRRNFLELLTILAVIACAIYSFWPDYSGPAQVQLDQGKISYQGRVAHQKFNGQGTLKIANQGTYVGQFVDGRFNGVGKYTATKGWLYSGHFKSGAISEQGQILNAQQQVIGKYKNGVLERP